MMFDIHSPLLFVSKSDSHDRCSSALFASVSKPEKVQCSCQNDLKYDCFYVIFKEILTFQVFLHFSFIILKCS